MPSCFKNSSESRFFLNVTQKGEKKEKVNLLGTIFSRGWIHTSRFINSSRTMSGSTDIEGPRSSLITTVLFINDWRDNSCNLRDRLWRRWFTCANVSFLTSLSAKILRLVRFLFSFGFIMCCKLTRVRAMQSLLKIYPLNLTSLQSTILRTCPCSSLWKLLLSAFSFLSF